MKVLVTGGAGFIGSHTVDHLLRAGYSVRVLDALQARVHPTGVPPWLTQDAELQVGDVTDRDELSRAMEGCDYVMHLAAYQDYLPDFSRFISVNAGSTALIFELIVSDPGRFPIQAVILASSQAVSGEGKYVCPAEGTTFWPGPRPVAHLKRGDWEIHCPDCGVTAKPALIDESTCNNPHTSYGISKYAAEMLAMRLGARYGIRAVAMRYTYVQGPRNSFYNAYSGIARRFAMRIRAGLPPICYEDGLQRRDYVNVADVARANLIALENPAANGMAYNVGGGRAVTVLEFARLMLAAAGSDLEPQIPGEFRLGDTRHTVSDISRMQALGWTPTIQVEQNVTEYLNWLDTQRLSAQYLSEAERVMAERGVVQRVEAR